MDGATTPSQRKKSQYPLPTVLVIDDNESNFIAISAVLQEQNCILIQARSGAEGLRILESKDPALILLDIQMPGMDGFEVAHRIRHSPGSSAVPIIFISGLEFDREELTKLYKLGAVDFLRKPFDAAILSAKANVFLELCRLRKMAQEEALLVNRDLQVSHEKYQTFVQQSADGMWRFEVENPILTSKTTEEQIQSIFSECYLAECNDAMARMYGFSKGEELVGTRLYNMLTPDDPQNVDYLRAFVESGYRLSDVITNELDRFGNEKHFSNSLVGFAENGAIVRAWGIQKDVTEQIISRKKLELTLTAADLGIFQWNLVTNDASWSEETYQILGFDGERPSPSYERFLKAVHPSDRSEVDSRLQRAITSRSSVKVLFRILNYEQEVHWVQVHASVFSGAGDKATYMLGTVQDFTDRKRIEEEAIESEQRFRLIVDAIPQGVWRTDPNGSADYFSERFRELVPCDTTQFLGWGWTEPIHPDDKPRLIAEWERCRAAAIPISVEFRLRADDGTYCWFRSDGRPFFDAKGAILKYYGTWTNIADEKKASIELENAKNAAEKANELKSAFLANMSHEIRTPLGAMIGFADLLRDPVLSEAEKQNYLEILHRNGVQLGHLINDILDLSKVETGHLNFEFLQFDPTTLVADCLAIFKVRAKEREIRLSVSVDSSAPSMMVSDPLRLRQILTNVLGNSMKFTERGSIEMRIAGTRSATGKPAISFTIEDSGIGIAGEGIQNLFKVFTQADNSITRRYGGTGLGLALSRSLARALGGDLELVETTPGKGSVFRLTVENKDVSAATAVLETKHASSTAVDSTLQRLTGLHILIVEDAKDNQKLIERYITKQGATSEIVENGLEGVKAATRGKFDIVLMDIQMPVMDGYSATSELRKNGYSVPILALTAHAMSDIRERCMTAGYTDYLPKPLNSKDLIQKIVDYTAASRKTS